MLGKGRFIIGSAITLGFLILLFYKTDFSLILSSLKKANYFLVVPAIAVYFISFWFKVVRWAYIIRPLKAISARNLFSINVIGYMVNNVLPGRIGELARAYLVGKKKGVSKSAILGTIAVERLFDGLALIFMVLVLFLFLPSGDFLGNLFKIMALIFMGIFIIFMVLISFPTFLWIGTDKLLLLLPMRWRMKVEGIIRAFVEGIKIMRKPINLIIIFAYSLLLWSVEAITGYLMGIAFDIDVSLKVYFLGTAAANLATVLPTTQAGIGPYEFFFKQTLVTFGISNSLAVAYVVLLHAILILPLTFLGFYHLWMENISFSQLTRPSITKN